MYNGRKVAAVILAAGKGTRMGFDKMLYRLDGRSVIYRSAKAFRDSPLVDEIVIVASDNMDRIRQECSCLDKVVRYVRGGDTRNRSVKRGIAALTDAYTVAIHDGARPYVSVRLIDRLIRAGCEEGRAIPAVREVNTVKVVRDFHVRSTPDRSSLWAVQTPQVFDLALYRKLSRQWADEDVTDDSQLFEKEGIPVRVVEGEYSNIKITTKEDLAMNTSFRIGHGYDVHRLAEDRPLVMGGVTIPYEKGLDGHSDADVVIHAVIDALLGAAALGDIGYHFPDSDERYRGADSMKLLARAYAMVRQAAYAAVNIDVTILCQRPKLAPYKRQMARNIAGALGLEEGSVSVKATTEEGLGFTGSGEGIACHCVALLAGA